jgi:hypothetical protein
MEKVNSGPSECETASRCRSACRRPGSSFIRRAGARGQSTLSNLAAGRKVAEQPFLARRMGNGL